MKLKAGFIRLDMETSLIHAKGITDSSAQLAQYPDMFMGEENFKAKELKYNLRKGKGIILQSYRKQNDLYIRSEKTKVIEHDHQRILYNANGIITTCSYPHPHFGIRSRKQKLILNKIAVIGPSNIEIGGIPTPLWLPFGFFPIKSGRTTGLIFPRDYEYSPELGFGLRNVGYYFPISDYMDMTLTGDIYLRGSYRVRLRTRYAKRYKYNGSVNLNFASIKHEIINREAGTISIERKPSFGISVSHRQDPKADPTRRFGGQVNIQTNSYKEDNYNDAESVLQNTLTSNLSYTQMFWDNKFTFTAGMTHSQNTSTHDIRITLPNIDLDLKRLYPFKRENSIGKEKWYEGISFKYDGKFEARLQTKDTILFTEQSLDTIQLGMLHEFSTDHTFDILKYVHVRPAMNFSSAWYPYSIRKELIDEYKIKYDTTFNDADEVIAITPDTLKYGIVKKRKIEGFQMQNLFNASISMNTTLYGTVLFKKGWLRGLRHVAKPFISMNYTPNYQRWGYIKEHLTDLRVDEAELEKYSIYEDGIFSQPAFRPTLGLSYGINNVFDAKIFSKKDSSEKNIMLLPRLSINSSYNFVADSFKMAPIKFNGNFSLFKDFSTVRFSGGFSVYKRDSLGELVDEYLWEDGSGFLRFEGLNVEVSTGFTFKQLRELIAGKEDNSTEEKKGRAILSIFDKLTIRHNMRLTYNKLVDRDTFYISSHEINISGSIPLSKNWNIEIGRIGYSFEQGRITYPDLGFSRDLHCWGMGLNWQPERGTYSFYLRVDPGTLDFLKLPYRKNQFDQSEAFY